VTTGAQLARTGEAGDDGSVPPWATIVVALGSGLGGAILSTLLRISHERDAEMRTRKIDAADAFGAAVITAMVELSEGIPRAEEIDPYLTPDASGLSDEADQLRRGLEDAVSKVAPRFPARAAPVRRRLLGRQVGGRRVTCSQGCRARGRGLAPTRSR
jgi:hypothetical protein